MKGTVAKATVPFRVSKNLFLTPLAEVTKAVKTSNSHSSAYRWYGRVGVAQ